MPVGYLPIADSYMERMKTFRPGTLMAYWPLAESGGLIAQDLSGNGLTGTYSGVVLANGNSGIGDGLYAPSFDGVNDYCNIYSTAFANALIASGAAGTLSLWFKVSGSGVWTDGIIRSMFRSRLLSGNDITIFKSSTNGFITFQYNAGGTDTRVDVSGQSMTDWTHIAMTWDKVANQLKGYINGAQASTTTTGLGTWAATNTLNNNSVIGAGDSTGGRPWATWITHVALWTVALSAGDIRQLAVRT